MVDGDHCAASPFQVGDGFPKFGYVVYISVLVDRQSRVVGWIYTTDRAKLLLQGNSFISQTDRTLAGLGPVYYGVTSPRHWSAELPFADLDVGPCPDALITRARP